MNHPICLIFNLAPKYREGIYTLIDDTYPCHWYFGSNDTDIKGLDLKLLKHVETVSEVRMGRGLPFYWQRGVCKLLRQPQYETFIVLGELFCLSTWWLLLMRNLFYRQKRIYLWSHGWYGKESKIRRLLKKAFFKMPNGVLLYGNHARNLMIEAGLDGNKLYVVHNSLNYDRQLVIRQTLRPTDVYRKHFGNDVPTLIFIGRLTAVKRLDLLIEALAQLRNDGSRFNLVLVGDGEHGESLRQLAHQRGVDDQVWFYGACYEEQTNAELIYNADLCVAPGNVGLTGVHSMMFGCPVLTHDSFEWQMPEFEAIRDGVTGCFFKRDDVTSLAEKITLWFSVHEGSRREATRQACYHEIDTQWTPKFQMEVIKNAIEKDAL